MLTYLRIRNLALIEEATVEFAPGFTAVTGETGAGKSILLGALNLLAGGRADRGILRPGSDACDVEAELVLADPELANRVLADAGLPACDCGQLLLRRVIPRERPPRIHVNGAVATLGTLQALGDLWIDFHGPGEPRRLLRPECQLELLDAAGGAAALFPAYRESYDTWRAAQRARAEAEAAGALAPEQEAFLRDQLAEIDALKPDAASIAELEQDFRRVRGSREIAEAVARVMEGLAGERGVAGRLAPVVRAARQLAALDPAAAEFAARIEALAVDAGDVQREAQRLADDLTFDPGWAAKVEERMSAWSELQRRHGAGVEAVVAARARLAARLEASARHEELLAELRDAEGAARREVDRRAAALRAARTEAAGALRAAALPLIATLGFRHAEFAVVLRAAAEPGPSGADEVEFHFSANAGSPAGPLARIASSGELARVMLALKTALADADRTPVLVFDEVDANVGGEVGRVVGRRLAQVAGSHQVLCITHLPQVASLARQHWVVEKEQDAASTRVVLRPVHGDRAAREGELARMLGDRSAASALAHARELLEKGSAQDT